MDSIWDWIFSIIGDIDKAGILGTAIKVVFLLIATKALTQISSKLIKNFFEGQKKLKKFGIKDRKADTLAVIIKSVVKYTLYFIMAVIILQEFGIETRSLIATAGIGGVAIGFGAKSLVQDVISGFFILFEDQYSIGEHIQIDEFEGIVEDMQIRVTKIRNFTGELHIIPNGSIQVVTNKSRGSMRAWVDVRIPYGEDVNESLRVLNGVASKIREFEPKRITKGPFVVGVTELGQHDIKLSMYAMTLPLEQWDIEREIRKEVTKAFAENGIEVLSLKRIVLDDSKE